jgi:K+-transporting ATPase KdpF subunit
VPAAATKDGPVIEDLVAAVIGIALLVYLAYALAHPERF